MSYVHGTEGQVNPGRFNPHDILRGAEMSRPPPPPPPPPPPSALTSILGRLQSLEKQISDQTNNLQRAIGRAYGVSPVDKSDGGARAQADGTVYEIESTINDIGAKMEVLADTVRRLEGLV